jgi:hypothetical protein
MGYQLSTEAGGVTYDTPIVRQQSSDAEVVRPAGTVYIEPSADASAFNRVLVSSLRLR